MDSKLKSLFPIEYWSENHEDEIPNEKLMEVKEEWEKEQLKNQKMHK